MKSSTGASGTAGNFHGSAAMVTTRAAQPPSAAGAQAAIGVSGGTPEPHVTTALGHAEATMNDRLPMTPPAGPTMTFVSDASTPATRRSPFAEFRAPARGDRGQEPPPAAPRVKARAASAQGRRRRSRSPHAAPSASDSTVAEAVRKLQAQTDNLQKQRADDRNWVVKSAQIEGPLSMHVPIAPTSTAA